MVLDCPGHLLAHPHRSGALAGTRTAGDRDEPYRFHPPGADSGRCRWENQIMTAVTACAPWVPAREDSGPACNDPGAAGLVARARGGDKRAWDALVERYAPLIWSICRKYRLGRADADDVGQSVWLRLVDQLDRVRDPAALPGWLATTARRECLRVLCATQGPRATVYARDVESLPDERTGLADQGLLAAERHAALREAFG